MILTQKEFHRVSKKCKRLGTKMYRLTNGGWFLYAFQGRLISQDRLHKAWLKIAPDMPMPEVMGFVVSSEIFEDTFNIGGLALLRKGFVKEYGKGLTLVDPVLDSVGSVRRGAFWFKAIGKFKFIIGSNREYQDKLAEKFKTLKFFNHLIFTRAYRKGIREKWAKVRWRDKNGRWSTEVIKVPSRFCLNRWENLDSVLDHELRHVLQMRREDFPEGR